MTGRWVAFAIVGLLASAGVARAADLTPAQFAFMVDIVQKQQSDAAKARDAKQQEKQPPPKQGTAPENTRSSAPK